MKKNQHIRRATRKKTEITDMEFFEISNTEAKKSTSAEERNQQPRFELVAENSFSKSALILKVQNEQVFYASDSFFDDCVEQLIISTRKNIELAGSVFAEKQGQEIVLTGLKREAAGAHNAVPIEAGWGSILWHTHPGLKMSLAAFSTPDIAGAKKLKRPLLVIGFSALSPDLPSKAFAVVALKRRNIVLGAATMGIQALLKLEKMQKSKAKLMKMGVVARVCYPSGEIYPVLRKDCTPFEAAIEEMSYTIDTSLGFVERKGQEILINVWGKIKDSLENI